MRESIDSDEERHLLNVKAGSTFLTESKQYPLGVVKQIQLNPKGLEMNHKLVIARIVKEVSYYHSIRKGDQVFSVEKAMEQPSIQKVIREEFKLDEKQIVEITKAVSKKFK